MQEKAQKDVQAGMRYLSAFDYSKAMSSFKRAAKADPNNPDAYYGMAEAAQGIPKIKTEDILSWYDRAVSLRPDPQYLTSRGAFCLSVGLVKEAEESYTKAAELNPENRAYYLSEFAVEYFYHCQNREEAWGPEAKKKVIGYLLRSVGISPEEAVSILRG